MKPLHTQRRARELHGLRAALVAPSAFSVREASLAAHLAVAQRAAVEGIEPPGEFVLVAVGDAAEVAAVVASLRGRKAGGLWAAEWSVPLRTARVVPLAESLARARDGVVSGAVDAERFFAFEVGDEPTCRREALRVRRVRAAREGRAHA